MHPWQNSYILIKSYKSFAYHHLSKITFRKMFEHFMNVNDKEILKKVSKIYNDHSIKITGRSEFIYKEVG